ncbi:FMN-binding negative transcriptional regulator [Mucilaginibacter ginsenosidivorans]|uniref:FMN-binding negative transcriptional regulator n=1 Tax=Mucilaginibacter ginsenosidivorans TaxID=398053 RepID=A0A5B8V1N7_9SPHI|nr:FMN-binding negative transcriptional regulator [Mucilaginibacter ginsenosidivorans]QEC64476.1 FMN-binding negative transcriptional regulator [Mucilaginibacter ginsenosidivorans]
MYTPSFNSFTDRKDIITFMQRYSFAAIVTVVDDVPIATHLPFLVKEDGDKLFLYSHFAKANPQSKEIFDKTSLVIFAEPHAYISPSNYEKETNVPTWNYIAVHAYGKATLLESAQQKTELLKHTINAFEAGYLKQWEGLPDDYRSRMMNGIVAFGIEVTDLQAKKKLSQNRAEVEKDNIIQSLEKSADTNEREIAAYMKQLKH